MKINIEPTNWECPVDSVEGILPDIDHFDHNAGKSERTPFDRSHYSTGNADIAGWLIVISLILLCIGGR